MDAPMSTIDEVARLLAAASRAPDPHTRAVYLGEARIILADAGVRLGELRQLLDDAQGELARLAALESD